MIPANSVGPPKLYPPFPRIVFMCSAGRSMFTRCTRLVALILVFAGAAFSARGQNAEAIVNQYVKAQGGSKALAKVQTVAIEGNFTRSSDGKTGTYTYDTRSPNRYYSEIVSGGQTLIQAYNGKSAWHQNANGELGTLVGPEGAQLEAAGQYYNFTFANAKKNKIGVAFIGHASVRGKDALQIELTFPSGVKRQVFFDPDNHWVVEESATVAGIDE